MSSEKTKSILTGLVTGFANGLFGAGGGTILVPAMQKFLHVETHKSHATAIAVILPISVLSAFLYLWGAAPDWMLALYISAGGVVGGFIGARLLSKLSSKWLHRIFGGFMMAAALRMIWGQAASGGASGEAVGSLWYMAIGLVSGIISGMGIGGGTVLIPALVIFFHMGQQAAQNINLIYFIPTATMALVTHEKSGNLEKKLIMPLVGFGLAGAAAGSFLALNTNPDWLRKGFGIFLMVMGLAEIFRKPKAVNGENG